ncbi:hypothetical protein HPP92_025131 [Vanilla planifolia]|uniref:Uncharacterized protein n=1 Tax=Vanilla planifolia TaxID=51239 RepID=A0A835PLP2_VANPL|nr:hypothetical protein HPP92_025131 [Vanilla planifolia]
MGSATHGNGLDWIDAETAWVNGRGNGGPVKRGSRSECVRVRGETLAEEGRVVRYTDGWALPHLGLRAAKRG